MNRISEHFAASRQTQILAGYFLAGLGAILFSAKAVVVKFTYRYGIDAVTLIAFRMLFAMPFFAAVAWWESRRAARGQIVTLTAKERIQICVLGLIGYYLSSFLDFLGLRYVSASLERLILFLSPSLVVLLSAWWLKRPITRRQLWAMILSYAGVVLVFAHDLSETGGGSDVVKGSLFVFASALSYSVYLICSGELVKRVGATRLVAYAMLVSCVACVIQFFVVHPPSVLLQPAGVYGYSLIHATLNTVLPVFMMMWAVALVGAPTASLLGMLGPVSVLFLAAWLLSEPITVWQLAGTALVLAGVFVLTGRRPVKAG
ncbi:DMT family transporter [Bordetella hinzii]|uniref:EamA/RhaT family transporter n=1 Tax=Bordetella hinzii TaxID=103855 RepID=A0AAN1VH28_9BORD|nr:DMT family transporter [Bordetella hinzii]AKQ60783.1 EamA-like transporter family protein [Bordetella hinzii]AZW18193.1 EamA/RhaT family transporter [Bordetella hinzii]KCB49122.1 EamA-like transporter family protein [Bordetella hinzii 1277]KCB49835.1 EamA-like transporter family protein [Bordetella hinzii 4161]KXA74577.1 multidrug DMT transporter permease [Bordetella hinzii LMG 13501]